MTPRRLAAALAATLLLAAPPGALAQEPPAPTDEPGELSEDPPPGLEEGPQESDGDPAGDDTTADGTELPDTGAEAVIVGLLGSGLLLTGAGLRVRLRAGARG